MSLGNISVETGAEGCVTRLSARLSCNDFPGFLLMVCQGDLSDITRLSSWGLVGSDSAA